MDHGQIERWVALLLPDRRADVDPLVQDIECHVLDRVVIDPHLDAMCARARGLTHFSLHGVVAIACEPVDNGTDDEVGAEILGRTSRTHQGARE